MGAAAFPYTGSAERGQQTASAGGDGAGIRGQLRPQRIHHGVAPLAPHDQAALKARLYYL
jgi:hypothetical protein